jgi:hypothetical protein
MMMAWMEVLCSPHNNPWAYNSVIIEVVVKIQWILPLHTEQAGLAEVGGKGANLARLACAGFPVPDGFLITTQAYRDFYNRQ